MANSNRLRQLATPVTFVCVVLLFCAVTAIAAPAQTLTTIYNFCSQPNCSDGSLPHAGLVQGTDGNFYGTTSQGDVGYGTVFKVTPSGALTTLHAFTGPDGADPLAALLQGTDGNLYGTTFNGGANDDPSCVFGGFVGCGTVYKVTPAGSLSTLYSFCSQPFCFDGSNPSSALIQGVDGNFYGTAGGQTTGGTFFKITPAGALTTLYNFCSLPNCADGEFPHTLVRGTDGNFYGTTYAGGTNDNCTVEGSIGCGTVFKITPQGTLTTLYSFDNTDGSYPQAGLVQGIDGNFYGTTSGGGADSGGTAFKITPAGMLTTLYSFCSRPNCTDGQGPYGELVQANDGNFYGTTISGGISPGRGTIFKITAGGAFTTLYRFCSLMNCADGIYPNGRLIQATDGNFYGTTYEGGAPGAGTAFQLNPTPLVPTTTVLTSAPNPSYVGQMVTMTATVTAQNGSTPTGTVIFNSDGTQIGSATLNGSGVAVLNFAGLSVGSDSLTAVYQGSRTLAASTSNTVTQVVMPASVTTLTSSPNPSQPGQQVTITATVGPAGPPAPTGTVSFTSNGSAISGCTGLTLPPSLMVVCTTSSLAVGTDVVVGSYSGDDNYGPSSGMVAQIVNPVPSPVQLVTATPCRIVDTRNPDGTFGGPPISGGTARSFPLAQSGNPCNIPPNVIAYSLNVTVVPEGPLGYLTIWPTGEGQPLVSTLNSSDGRVKANAAIVPAGTPSGSVSVYVTNTTNVILDISGYFFTGGAGTLQFYPLTPCRVVDTRQTDFPLGLGAPSFDSMETRQLPVLTNSPCLHGLPNTPQAYSFNVTVVPYPAGQPLNYLTIWPSNEQQPTVSTLNNPTATVVANAAVVPADPTNGNVSVFTYNSTDVIIDINGYFGAPGENGDSFYVVTPCRAYDSRNNNGQPFMGERTVPIAGSQCAPPASAAAYVFNATVVPSGAMPYLTLWPDMEQQPTVSTLNAYDGYITSNMAIVPNLDGSIDAYAAALTQLILDISGYFAP
jgi:uncharacterized repeat protein (TIGR03803 family)